MPGVSQIPGAEGVTQTVDLWATNLPKLLPAGVQQTLIPPALVNGIPAAAAAPAAEARRSGRYALAAFALAAAFISFLWARTRPSDSASTTSATERCVPFSP
ncbi:Uncharacterised protein [Mycobacteroides abscessus subsp. abscessus]|nr:Uncharacterised protein [Mycobacteroides abscessus subsp. abscessus]